MPIYPNFMVYQLLLSSVLSPLQYLIQTMCILQHATVDKGTRHSVRSSYTSLPIHVGRLNRQ